MSRHWPATILKPGLHLHLKEPITLTHSAPGHAAVSFVDSNE